MARSKQITEDTTPAALLTEVAAAFADEAERVRAAHDHTLRTVLRARFYGVPANAIAERLNVHRTRIYQLIAEARERFPDSWR